MNKERREKENKWKKRIGEKGSTHKKGKREKDKTMGKNGKRGKGQRKNREKRGSALCQPAGHREVLALGKVEAKKTSIHFESVSQ